MPATPPFSVEQLDLDNPRAVQEDIARFLPHRGPMRQLDSVAWWSEDRKQAIGIKNVRDDEFWVNGHIPGRPLYPGVLMIEAAAQLCSFAVMQVRAKDLFLGFTRCNDCSFRGLVVPGDQLVLYAESISENARRFVSQVNGFVEEKHVFEVTITGMVM